MSKTTVDQLEPRHNPRPSTRHLAVDERFARLLSEDENIPTPTILKALAGEPQRQAIEVVLWAVEKTEHPAHALECWARKHQRGAFRKPRRNLTPAQQRAELDRRVERRIA